MGEEGINSPEKVQNDSVLQAINNLQAESNKLIQRIEKLEAELEDRNVVVFMY